MAENEVYDLVIVGGGPGGLNAALRNTQTGGFQELAVDGGFIFIGFIPNTNWFRPASGWIATATWRPMKSAKPTFRGFLSSVT
jgi:thioredoxin reductase